MLYILHGDDSASSRNYISQIADSLTPITLDGKTISKKMLEEYLISTGLFSSKKAYVIENLFSKNAKKKELAIFVNNLKTDDLIIFWEEKKLLKTSLNLLKNATIKEFNLPSYYFEFLDSVSPVNKKKVFLLYQKLLTTHAPELVLFSLIKRIRLLVILSKKSSSSELSKMAPWQISRLESQLRQWNAISLVSFYEELKNTEIRLKTGNIPINLSKYLDILLLSRLT